MNYYIACIRVRWCYRQCRSLLKPDSTLHYSSSRRFQFSCMLSIAKYSSKLNMMLPSPSNSCYYKRYRQWNYYTAHIRVRWCYRQCKLWLMPDSILHYSSNKHMSFNCMLSIMEYSSKLSMKQEMLGNTRYCIASKVKNCYRGRILLILLNKPCKLWLKPDSILHYSSSKHMSFSSMLSIIKYSSKLSMRQLSPDNIRYCKKYKLLSSDYMCYNM